MNYSVNNTFCRKCKLHENVKNPMIFGKGDLSSSILFLGECPGKNEDEQGQVLTGRSGQFLQYVLNNVGVTGYISNSVLCRPTDTSGNNVTLKPTQIECCFPFTIDLILKMKPKVIVLLGSVAMRQLLGFSINMEIARGKDYYHNVLNAYIVPTYHPAYLLRINDNKFSNEFIDDIKLAKELSNKPPVRRIVSNPVSYKDPFEIEKYFNELKESESFAVDIETTSLNPRTGRITDISFCNQIGKGVHIEWKYLSSSPVLLKLLKEILTSPAEKVFHNASFDVHFLRSVGIDVTGTLFDTMLAYHALTMSYEGGKASSLYRLKTLTWFLTREGGYEDILTEHGGIVGIQKNGEVEKEREVNQGSLFDESELARAAGLDPELNERLGFCSTYINDKRKDRLDSLKIGPKAFYSGMDSDVTYRIYKYLKPNIIEQLNFPFYEIIMPLCKTLIRIHENGIMIDLPYINKMIEENNKVAEQIKSEFFKEAGYEFNLNSTDDLREFIYDKLGISVNPKFVTKKGKKPSTDEEAITFFAEKKPVLKKILDYRGVNKQTTTYFEGYKKLAEEGDRIYPGYLQIGTASGRLSCKNPNLHNVPRDNRVRNMIIPRPGHKIIIADLSQVELRVLAMVSGDQNMIHAFESGHDFHTYTACTMFGIDINDFDKNIKEHNEKRSVAKTINFGLVYQRQARTLAESLHITLEAAQSFMNRFFKTYPKVSEWISYTKSFARAHGYVETIYGRRRYLPFIKSSIEHLREGAERQSVNTPIQSAAADICAVGLIRFQEWLDLYEKKSLTIGTVHDSILTEVPDEDVEEVSIMLPQIMTKDIPKVTVELKADVDVLDKWTK